MERRSHRIAILAGVVVLHLLALAALRTTHRSAQRAPPQADRPLAVEFLLRSPAPERADELPMPRVRRESVDASAPAAASPPPARAEPVVETPTPARTEAPDFRLVGDDGRLRVPKNLANELDAEAAERRAQAAREARSFHMPEGDRWVMREAKSPIDPGLTRFSDAWMPPDMNPVEEACWRNKGLAMVMSILGSLDCADPGGPTRRPTPEMIVYGKDSGEVILRKSADWKRYGRR